MIFIRRHRIITKERMENYCKGNENDTESVNDDLETLVQDLQLGSKLNQEVWTYFLPKLTEDELKLVEQRDFNYFDTCSTGYLADVDEAEMKASESNSKFVYAYGIRRTFRIENPLL